MDYIFFVCIALINIANMVHQLYLPNLARNLAGAGLGQISEKRQDSGFAAAGAEI